MSSKSTDLRERLERIIEDLHTEGSLTESEGPHIFADRLEAIVQALAAEEPPTPNIEKELVRAVTVLCETRGHAGNRPCKFCSDMHLWALAPQATKAGPTPDVQRCLHGKSVDEHCEQCVIDSNADDTQPAAKAGVGERLSDEQLRDAFRKWWDKHTGFEPQTAYQRLRDAFYAGAAALASPTEVNSGNEWDKLP